jgi:hypothetical protein
MNCWKEWKDLKIEKFGKVRLLTKPNCQKTKINSNNYHFNQINWFIIFYNEKNEKKKKKWKKENFDEKSQFKKSN